MTKWQKVLLSRQSNATRHIPPSLEGANHRFFFRSRGTSFVATIFRVETTKTWSVIIPRTSFKYKVCPESLLLSFEDQTSMKMVAPQFLVKMIMDTLDKMVPGFLGTGDITHEDEFRFHQ